MPWASVMRVKKGVKGREGADSATSPAWVGGLGVVELRGLGAVGLGALGAAKIAEGGRSAAGDSCEASLGRAEGRREGVLLEEVGRGIMVTDVGERPNQLHWAEGLHLHVCRRRHGKDGGRDRRCT